MRGGAGGDTELVQDGGLGQTSLLESLDHQRVRVRKEAFCVQECPSASGGVRLKMDREVWARIAGYD